MAGPVGEVAHDAWNRSRDCVREAVDAARSHVATRSHVARCADQADELVRARPMAAIAVAFGSGVAAALLLSSRPRRR